MAVVLDRQSEPAPTQPRIEDPCMELCEEDASQGHKTGHMRYVLAVGLGLAVLAMLVLVLAFAIS